MGLSDIPRFFGARGRAKVGAHHSYGVTQLGKQKAEEFALSGPRFDVLAHLAEHSPCSVSEIEKECHMSKDKVESILRSLMNDGYVQPVSQGV